MQAVLVCLEFSYHSTTIAANSRYQEYLSGPLLDMAQKMATCSGRKEGCVCEVGNTTANGTVAKT